MEKARLINRFPAGLVTPPPSKSLSHRALICAALASDNGESILENLGASNDITATEKALSLLCATAKARVSDESGVTLVDCGESGSTLRFLVPLAAIYEQEIAFTGQGLLMERPMAVYEAILRQAGAFYTHEGERIRVRGPMKAGDYKLPGNISSQFISGLLLALPLLDGDSGLHLTTSLESTAYVDMTIDVMARFGVTVAPTATGWRLPGNQRYKPTQYRVEADYSQAAFFLAAAALGRDVRCRGLSRSSVQGDMAIIRILEEMGAVLTWKNNIVSVESERLKPVTVDAREIPDLIPPIAVLCCYCDGKSRIVNAGRLRFKESDRLHALALELGSLGADITEEEDSLTIHGKPSLPGGDVHAHNDHRIAMAMAVAAIRCDGPVRLTGWESVSKSYPAFWDDFEKEDI